MPSPILRLLALIALLAPPTIAQNLPDRILVGYWHNWASTPRLTLANVPAAYDVINIAFATPTTPLGATMRFSPSSALYPTPAAFIADVRALQAAGKKVLISIGGGNDPVHIKTATDAQNFASSMAKIIQTYGFDGIDIDLEGSSLTLQAGDRDFRNPTSPLIVNFLAGINQLLAGLPSTFMLTAAPETAHVQGGYGTYAGVWGMYLPVLHALRNRLTYVHVQHYNSGTMYGRDGKIYAPATVDFHVAMAESLLAGFRVDAFSRNLFFSPLRPDQVAIGLPASTRAAGSGYTAPPLVKRALESIYLGRATGGSYSLANAGYPRFRGLMTWSINWDVANNLEFATNYRPVLDTVFLRADATTVPQTGGTVNFALHASGANPSRNYVLGASLSGTTPGTPLGPVTLPLNVDALTALSLVTPAWFAGFVGTVDAGGDASAALRMPSLPGTVGVQIDFAYALTTPFDFASNPVRVTIVP